MPNPLDNLLGSDNERTAKRLREESDSKTLSSVKNDIKALLSSSRTFFKKENTDKLNQTLKQSLKKLGTKPKKTSAVGRSMGLLTAMAKMSKDAILEGQVDHTKYSSLIEHDTKTKTKTKNTTTKASPSKYRLADYRENVSNNKTTTANPVIINEEQKEVKKRGRPKGSKNKPKEIQTEKKPSAKKHDESQTKKIESKVEKSSESTNKTIKSEISRLIKSNETMEKDRIARADKLRRQNIDYSPEEEKPKAKAVKPTSPTKNTDQSPKAVAPPSTPSMPNMKIPGVGGVMAKAMAGGKALAGSTATTLTGSVGTASAGAIGLGVGTSAVAGLAIGNYLTESGMLGEDMAKGYSLGDFMSSWFGEGTRNLKRHLDIEKAKELKSADKTFKVMTPRSGPWQNVSKQKMAELRRNPSKYGKVIEAYYRLWMRETELRVISNVMSSHEDADKMGPTAVKDANDMWRMAMEDRIDFKKKHIIGPKAENTEKKLSEEKRKNDVEETKKLNDVAIDSLKSTTTTKIDKTSVSNNAQTGMVTNGSDSSLGFGDYGSKSGNNSKAIIDPPKTVKDATAVIDNRTKAIMDGRSQGKTFENVTGGKEQGNLEMLKSFLLNSFAPVLASHIVKQSEEKRKENSSKNRSRSSSPNIMGAPEMFL